MKTNTNRRGFIAGVIGALFTSKLKAEKKDLLEYEYFKAVELRDCYKRVFLDDKEIQDVSEMLASPKPNISIQGFVVVYIKDLHGDFKLKTKGNKEYATLITKKIEGMIRWEPLKRIE